MPTLAQRIADLAARTAAEIKALPKGTVTGVTGTAPIASSGGAAPVISIAAATTGTAGAMSAADKIKLDGIAAGAGPVVYSTVAEVKTGTETGKVVSPKMLKDSNVVLPAGGSTGQILAKASATDFDRVWVDPPSGGGGGAAPALHPGYVSTHSGMANWYTGWDAPMGTQNAWASGAQVLLHPLVLPVAATIAKLGIVVNTAGTGATCRLAIYANAGGRPTTRLAEAPVVSAASTGFKESVLATPLSLAAGTYWLASCASGYAANFKGYGYDSGSEAVHSLGIYFPLNMMPSGGSIGGLQGPQDMPATITAGQVQRNNGSTHVPAIFFQVS